MAGKRKMSRYAAVPTQEVTLADGTQFKVMGNVPARRYEAAQVHIVEQGDRLDLLAYRYYGDAGKWWVIADANVHLLHPWELPTDLVSEKRLGQRIVIPYNPTRV